MLSDVQTLWRIARGMPGGASHAERLQTFYAPQAGHYDAFRERLLHGRRELLEHLAPPAGARVVELGGGTGRNLAFFGARLRTFARVEVVDLCPALLDRARERWASAGNVVPVEADARHWRPDAPVDVVYFSYALTMIPEWEAAVDNAIAMLKPGGRLGVVDFTLPATLGPLARRFWRAWFGHDGVRLDERHLPALRRRLPRHEVRDGRGAVPYLSGLRAPYFEFVGTRD